MIPFFILLVIDVFYVTKSNGLLKELRYLWMRHKIKY